MNTHILPASLCYVCGSEAVRLRERRAVAYGGLTIDVDDEYMRCPGCNEEFYAPGQAEAVDARASVAARSTDRILPYEVRAIRKKLGLTQHELEAELGLGAKVVTRWERGTSEPPTPTVLLLRALENGSLTIALLRAMRTPVRIQQPLLARLTFPSTQETSENESEFTFGTDNYIDGTFAVDREGQSAGYQPHDLATAA